MATGRIGVSDAMTIKNAATSSAASLGLSSDHVLNASLAVPFDTVEEGTAVLPTVVISADGDYILNGAADTQVHAPVKVTVEIKVDGATKVLGQRSSAAQPPTVVYALSDSESFSTGGLVDDFGFDGQFQEGTTPNPGGLGSDHSGSVTITSSANPTWGDAGSGFGGIQEIYYVAGPGTTTETMGTFTDDPWVYRWNHARTLVRFPGLSPTLYPTVRLRGTVHNFRQWATGAPSPVNPESTAWELRAIDFGGVEPTNQQIDLGGYTQIVLASGSGPSGTQTFDVTVTNPTASGELILFMKAAPTHVPADFEFSDGLGGTSWYSTLVPWPGPNYLYPGSHSPLGYHPSLFEGGSQMNIPDLALTYNAGVVGGGGLPDTARVRVPARKRLALTTGQVVSMTVSQDSGLAGTLKGTKGTLLQVEPA